MAVTTRTLGASVTLMRWSWGTTGSVMAAVAPGTDGIVAGATARPLAQPNRAVSESASITPPVRLRLTF